MKRTSAQIASEFVARREGRQPSPAPRRPPPKRLGPAKLPIARRPSPPKPPKHETLPITRQQIEALRAGAVATRDRLLASICDRALAGEAYAINACKAAVHGLA